MSINTDYNELAWITYYETCKFHKPIGYCIEMVIGNLKNHLDACDGKDCSPKLFRVKNSVTDDSERIHFEIACLMVFSWHIVVNTCTK